MPRVFTRSATSAAEAESPRAVLDGFAELLDPALTSPDTGVEVGRTTYHLRDIDARFSRSVGEGLEHVRKSRMLSALEVELLRRLADLDAHLSRQDVRRGKPATATRVQRLLRDFSCRLVRRTIGARTCTVLDAGILREFQAVVEDERDDRVTICACCGLSCVFEITVKASITLAA